jgi:hypothetical protein
MREDEDAWLAIIRLMKGKIEFELATACIAKDGGDA